jgi:hypothetical protein
MSHEGSPVGAILKALRRVESESAQMNETPPVQKKLDARNTIREKYRKSWATRRLFIVLLPLLTLAIALWLVSSYKPFLIPDSSTAAVKSNPVSSKPAATAKKPVLEDRRKHSEAAFPTPSKTSVKKEKQSPSDPTAGQREGPSPQDPEFEIQAIVWADVPESRFAVINGVIVRAGGIIEGVSVTDIGTDYVSFKSGQRTWKMKITTE